MKSRVILGILALAVCGWLGSVRGQNAHPVSADLERMKSLAGTWKGTANMGQGSSEITVEYRVVSGGSTVEERVFAGTPKEMVTMYHDKGGKLSLTHYCMLGNTPGMLLESSDPKTLSFDFDKTCGVNAKTEMHMHSLTITFEDADTITQNWVMYANGAGAGKQPFTLKRVKT